MILQKVKDQYDVIIAGAGNAGLSAALYLAKQGKKVILLEKNMVPGGCATSFVRGRFEMDPSMHELCDVGPEDDPGGVRKLLSEYGVEMDWKRVKTCFRMISRFSDGAPMDVTMPTGREEFLDAMEKEVPGCREKAELFMALMEEVSEALGNTASPDEGFNPMVLRERYANVLHVGGCSVDEVMDAIELPQRCRDIYGAYWSYLGVDTAHLSFLHYASMVYLYIVKGPYIPAHSSHALVSAMEQRFRELGGTLLYGVMVERFLYQEEGGIRGVTTTAGEFYAGCVLANINPEIVYGRMVPTEHVPPREKKQASARKGRLCGRMFGLYLGLNRTAEELGIKDHCIFLSNTASSSEEYASIMRGGEDNRYAFFICYNVTDKGASPEGTCLCSFSTFFPAQEWEGLSGAAYEYHKKEVAQRLLTIFKEKTGIDLSPYIEEIVIATPQTLAWRVGVPEGSAYGYSVADWDNVIARTMTAGKDQDGDGVFCIGAAGPRGVGYNSAFTAGRMGAQLALKYLDQKGILNVVEDVAKGAADLLKWQETDSTESVAEEKDTSIGNPPQESI